MVAISGYDVGDTHYSSTVPEVGNDRLMNINSITNGKPTGFYYTDRIVRYRDLILTNEALNYPIPEVQAENGNGTVWDYLIDDLTMANGQGKIHFYFPAASYCHAYSPSVRAGEVLDDKFKAGNWYLPIYSELVALESVTPNSAKTWSSLQSSVNQAWCRNCGNNSNSSYQGKNDSATVIACCVF